MSNEASPTPTNAAPCDWPEDFSDENGNYQNRCCECHGIFIGHKGRIVCKLCTAEKASIETSPAADDIIELREPNWLEEAKTSSAIGAKEIAIGNYESGAVWLRMALDELEDAGVLQNV